MTGTFKLFALILVLSTSAISEAGILYGGSAGPRDFYEIDRTSGFQTLPTNEDELVGLAYDPNTDTLYGGNDKRRLVKIDPSTGDVTVIKDGVQPLTTIDSMTFDPITDTLYGGNDAGAFFTIDPSNGDIGMINSSIGVSIAGLAFNPVTNKMYGGSDPPTNERQFFEIDIVTGNATIINADTGKNISALAFADGVLYGGSQDNEFFSIDVTTGVITPINDATMYKVESLTFITTPVPEPSTYAMAADGVVGARAARPATSTSSSPAEGLGLNKHGRGEWRPTREPRNDAPDFGEIRDEKSTGNNRRLWARLPTRPPSRPQVSKAKSVVRR